LLAVKGRPEAIELILKVDDCLEHIGREMGVPPQFLLTRSERVALQQKLADAAGQAAAAQAAQQQQLAQAKSNGGAQPVAMA
jgi:hypothetical protein